MGLSPRPLDQHAPLAAGAEESARPEKYYEPPLMQVIPSACEACEEKGYEVSNMCKGCLSQIFASGQKTSNALFFCRKAKISKFRGEAKCHNES